MVRKKLVVVGGVLVVCGIAAHVAVPRIVASRVRYQLAANGFPGATVGDVSLGLGSLTVQDVHLADGVDLGSVRLDRGVSLLWSKPDRIAIADARVSMPALHRASKMAKAPPNTAAKPHDIQLTVTMRDPKAKWTAEAHGHVAIGGPVDADFAISVRGVGLRDALSATGRMTGQGTLDASAQIRVRDGDVAIQRAEVHARAPGTLQLTDGEMRDRIVKAQTPLGGHLRVANALADFKFVELSAQLAEPNAKTDVTVKLRGAGRRNGQELDIAMNVRGLRALLASYIGGAP